MIFPRNISNDATIRAHAVTLLYKMITDDQKHAVEMLPLLYAKLTESQTNQNLEDSQLHHLQNRIMQVLLVLQPMLEKVSRHILRLTQIIIEKISELQALRIQYESNHINFGRMTLIHFTISCYTMTYYPKAVSLV